MSAPVVRSVEICDALAPPHPADAHPLAAQFARVVGRRPQAVAVEDRSGTLTYGELARRARLLAARIEASGAAGPVALFAQQGREALTAMVAVVLARRPLVVLDPLLPEDRLMQISANAGAGLAVVDDDLADRYAQWGSVPRIPVTLADTVADSGLETSERFATPSGGDVATIVYTSGSSGVPKGVALSHAAVANGARISHDELRIDETDRVALILPYAFAAGQEVVFMALLNGARVQCVDPRIDGVRGLHDVLEAWGTTTLHATPSLLRAFVAQVEPGRVLSRIRLLTTCGEAIHGRDVEAARKVLPDADFSNYLGSSETGQLSYFHLSAQEPPPAGLIPAGRPVYGKEMRIISPTGERLAAGETGRIQVVSAYLSSGYWGDSALTAGSFSHLEDGRSAFVSGDLGRLESDGTLVLAGRHDDAVKIRGYLVEPAEVEAALRGIVEVTDAVVLARSEPAGNNRLVAYVAVDHRRRTPAVSALRRQLRSALPDWMMPSAIVLLDDMPRNERGKVDRAALPPVPPREPSPGPRTQWEVVVAAIWRSVLGVDFVGRDETFTALGGDSLAVEEMLAAVQRDTGVRLATSELANAPTLRELAALVAASRSGRTLRRGDGSRLLLRLAPAGTETPVVCLAGAGGTGLLFADLASGIGRDRAVYAFQTQGLENTAIPDWSVQAAARRYVREVVRLVPERRVVLAGHSLGGLFALEVAQMLISMGWEVPLVVVLDTVLPPSVAARCGDTVPDIRIPGGRRQSRLELAVTRAQLLVAGLYPFSVETRNRVFFQHGLRLTDRYEPRPWRGRTEVFLTAENIDKRTWWDALLLGERTMHELDCNHVDLLKKPYVEGVGHRILSVLESLEASR